MHFLRPIYIALKRQHFFPLLSFFSTFELLCQHFFPSCEKMLRWDQSYFVIYFFLASKQFLVYLKKSAQSIKISDNCDLPHVIHDQTYRLMKRFLFNMTITNPSIFSKISFTLFTSLQQQPSCSALALQPSQQREKQRLCSARQRRFN